MKLAELKTALGIADGKVAGGQITISTNTLTKNLNDVLKYCYDNQPIVIDNAGVVSEDATTNTLTLQGTGNLLNVADLPVSAVFSLDAQGQAQLFIRYELIGDMPQTNSWNFSRSFPNLPTVPDDSEPTTFDRRTHAVGRPQVSPISRLWLYNTSYVVTSAPQQDPVFNVALAWGINFVSKLKPQGFLAVIENVFKHTTELIIYGTVRKPIAAETPQQLASRYPSSLERYAYPWSITENLDHGLPGILLKVDLGIDYTIANGKIEFAAEQLLFYTPCDTDWVLTNTNPEFAPVQAYTGRLSLPGTGVAVDMLAPINLGHDELQLIANFEGFKLDKLAKLTGLTGSDSNPLKMLPDEIQELGDELGDLQLIDATISVDYSFIDDIDVTYASFTVGMPDLNWSIWKDDLEIEGIFCRFEFHYPFSPATDDVYPRESIITVYGTLEIEKVPFLVYVSSQDDFTVNASMEAGQKIPLNAIMKKYAPGVPAPSDLTINTFRLVIAPEVAYTMAMSMASYPKPWVIPVGPKSIIVSNVSMGFTLPSGGSISGTVAGQIALGDFAELDIVYDIPGDIQARSLLPEIRLRQVVDTLTDQLLVLPKDFDVTFKNNSILFKKQGADYVFQLATELEGFGDVGLQVQKIGAKWGVAFGLDMTAGLPSALPGIGVLALFEKMFALQKLMLVVSSFDAPQFQFPDLASVNNPLINAKKISLPTRGTQMTAGLNIYGEWAININDKKQKLLKQLLGLQPSLGITIQVGEIPEAHTKLFVDFTSSINGHPLVCQFGGQMEEAEVGIFLVGSMTVNIQKQPQTFSVVLLFVENGAFISASMSGPGTIKFGSFQMSDLALEVGIDWEGIPSLGVAATIAVDKFQSSVAVFFDSADPLKSLVAGSVVDLNAKDVLDTLVGGKLKPSPIDDVLEKISIRGTHQFKIPAALGADLEQLKFDSVSAAFQSQGGITIPVSVNQLHLVVAQKGSVWYLTDMTTMHHYQLRKNGNDIDVSIEAQLYCAPVDTAIGAIKFPQGFFINCAIDFLGFNADATIDISTSRGIAIDAQTDKIVIGTEVVFALKAAKGPGGPIVSASTFTQPKHPVKEFRPPHFYINGSLEMLGIVKATFVTLTTKGFEFDLNGNLVPGVFFDLHGMFAGPQHLAVGGGIKVGLGTIDLGPIGKVHIDTDADGSLDIQVHGQDIGAKVSAQFEALGKKHRIGTFGLDVSDKALAKLPALLAKKAEALLNQTAKDLLKGVEDAQKKVDDLNKQIANMRNTVKKEHDVAIKRFNDAKADVDKAQEKVDGLNKQIKAANKKISDLKAAIAKKKEWSKHGNIFQKAARGTEYAAYAAEKGTEITGLYTEIGGLTTAKKSADAALTLAKQPLRGLAAAAKVVPVDSDPRVASLLAAKATATEALNAARLPLKALSK